MSDEEFDEKITEDLCEQSAVISDFCIDKINPWSTPFKLITWGLILNLFTFQFLYLQYVLPTIGIVLLYLGSRILKNSNKSFNIFNKLCVINLFWRLLTTGLTATKINQNTTAIYILYILSTVLTISILIALHCGIKQLFNGSETQPPKSPILFLIAINVITAIIALSGLGELPIIAIVLIILYIIAIKLIFKNPTNLHQVGFELIPVKVKLNGKFILTVYFALCVLVVCACGFFISISKPDAKPYLKQELTDVKTNLRNDGYNGKSLEYLAEEEAELLTNSHDISEGNQIINFYKFRSSDIFKMADSAYMEHTIVNMSNEDAYAIVYFKWDDNVTVWQDAFNCYMEDLSSPTLELIGGKLFYEKDGKAFCSPISELTVQNREVNSVFMGSSNSRYATGKVSYPLNSKNKCGYIILKVRYDTTINGNIIFQYYHARTFANYPYVDPVDKSFQAFSKTTRQYCEIYTAEKPNFRLEKQNSQ